LCWPFDNGASSEFNTLPATDWMAHTPAGSARQNFGVPADAFKNIPLQNRWIFQGKVPGPLAEAQEAVASRAGSPEYPFVFSLYEAPKAGETEGGYVQIADSSNLKVSKTVAAGLVTVKPGGLRTMHCIRMPTSGSTI
jgi:oxalate decarboxylase